MNHATNIDLTLWFLWFSATYTNCSSDFIADLNARREVLESKVAELEESWLELEMSLEEAV